MKILAVGISHKTAAIEVRELFHLKEVEQELLLAEMKAQPWVAEAFVISTCNRVEVYASVLDDVSPEMLLDVLRKAKHPAPPLEQHRDIFYELVGQAAVHHLLRVAAGLDSLVLGEKQILGQLKNAVDLSRRKGMLGTQFNILSNIAIRAGKKAQAETAVGSGGVSVSWAAVSMAEKILGDLRDRSVLIVGAGKMSKLAAGHFIGRGIKELFVMNRTQEKAAVLAQQFGGQPVSFWELKETLARADVAICAAGAPHYLIDQELVADVMAGRQDRPLVLLDISMPRNVDPAVQKVPGTLVKTIDDLTEITGITMQRRMAAVEQVERIVSNKMGEFYTKLWKNRSPVARASCVGAGDSRHIV